MSYHWSDNVHTTAFTPRDYQVELLASAFERNVIVCLSHKSSKEFIALKLIQELAADLRKSTSNKLTVYISEGPESPHDLIYHLTDLKILNLISKCDDDYVLKNVWDSQVVICDAHNFKCLITDCCLKFDDFNLIVIEDCHKFDLNPNAWNILPKILEENYLKAKERPKILALAGPFHNAKFNELGVAVKVLEDLTFCDVETTSDIVTVLRYCTKPFEYVIQCAPPNRDEFINFLEEIAQTRMAFLEDHRFDPSEIYSDEFLDELKDIPDPKKEPTQFLSNYIRILHEMGPWCADRAALNLLTQIEKQKVKTPYERHFLLLCLVSTTLVEIRAHSDYVFQKIENEKDRVEKYSTPKVLRLFEILRKFKPDDEKTNHDNLAKASDEIENLDFRKLQIELEKTFQSIDKEDSKDTVSDVIENLENILHITNRDDSKNSEETEVKSNTTIRKNSTESILKTRRTNGNRQKRKHFSQGGRNRHNNNNSADPDALYGIIFCNRKNTAKVLFDLLCEMSRHDPDLTFLNVQYTVDRVADPLTEPKEAELEHRRQEEVLKRFRMHECNLLIGTAVLEEGIDLPKCNLVIRWDRPDSYRSYVQCKGRARAQQAYHIILVAATLDSPNNSLNGENLSDKSHRYMCIAQEDNQANTSNSSESGKKSETNLLSSETGENSTLEEEINETAEKINNSETIKENGSIEHNEKVFFEIESIDELLNASAESNSVSKKPKSCVVKITEETQSDDKTDLIYKIDSAVDDVIGTLAEYREVEKLLLLKCANGEPNEEEHQEADKYTNLIEAYKPVPELLTGAYVDLSSAVALINKYCAKLPSDTFTKLTPLWRCAKTTRSDNTLYLYSLRMPINSPLKHDIQGLPMPSKVLGRRMVALMACRELHKCGELDDNLQPIGKEGFKASEPDWEDFELEKLDEQIVSENSEPRPGTTKRRQYYYKRIASEFSECRPTVGSEAYLYIINMTLQCPIPEEQNTRGRRIYPPEEASQGFGILTLKKIPKVSSFPIFTRSGEVKVSIELSKDKVILTDEQILRINAFVNYTFTNVLRLQKYLMLFDAEAMENCVYIVPTMKADNDICIDWDFLEQIYINSDKVPRPIPEDERKNIEFDPNKFKDAVVMPWYRNQDQPQYFYVAEICYHLTPESCFPGENYRTFQEYYFRKYGITVQNSKQPLLDVDHTSARLNFLTPRYVNRKGVALPTSSEETKRAKRENLEQKQILVPELCTIHPFPASLWRAAVCLPCILYRINGLLLADEIRKMVSYDLGLGKMEIENDNFDWPTLHFGWSLAEVLKKSREAKQFTKSNSIENDKQFNKSKNIGCDVQSGKDVSDNKKREIDQDSKTSPDNEKDEKTANDLLEEADEKLKGDCLMEIGTWSNDMANNIGDDQESNDNEDWGILPPNVNLCSRNNTNIRYGSPTSWDVGSTTRQRPIENYFTDSDASYQSDDDYDLISTESSDDQTGPFRIEFKSNNVAEAIETEEEKLKMQKQLTILENTAYNEREYQRSKNDVCGYEFVTVDKQFEKILNKHSCEYMKSVAKLKSEMMNRSDMVVSYDKKFEINRKTNLQVDRYNCDHNLFINFLNSIFAMPIEWIKNVITDLSDETCKSSIDHLQNLNALLTSANGPEKYIIEGSGDIFDNFNDFTLTAKGNSKEIFINFENSNKIKEICYDNGIKTDNITNTSINDFSFDYQPDLLGHPGPSPSIILQALTMSNANDGINLERLETIGDSFLKYAITTYLYCTYEDVHEGKLSHLRSKQVSNLNLYRLGRRKVLGECMIATKFEPHDNWLPPCYYVPKELEKALIEAKIPACHWNLADLPNIKDLSSEEICELVKKKAESLGLLDDDDYDDIIANTNIDIEVNENFPCFIPYNLVTQHSIPDKSVADCVEALIGAYLIECGPRGALLFMAWLGIRVLPICKKQYNPDEPRIPGSTRPNDNNEIIIYGDWVAPKSPLLTFAPSPYKQLDKFLDGYSEFEKSIGYMFRDRSYLLQAMTHASYSPNRLTDCYQRLEFLGDAVLDYLITRHLYEDPRQHSPGALTDLRSALVNNTIFASLAVRHGFHKYFKHLSPGLNEVIDRFVRIQHENGHSISEEYYLLSEEECDDAEDVEVPKALGDVFESVAGAIFLDSNMSLDTVWKVYSNMMKPEIEQFSNSVPKSPIRELLELEPETAKFGKPEKLADGRRVRVTVDVFGKGTFRGIGRNYRIAKCTAAKCALRQLKKQGLISKKH